MKGEIQFACLSLNGVVILKVAGSYNLKHARFVQRQIKILCMLHVIFQLGGCICVIRFDGVCCKWSLKQTKTDNFVL